MKYADMTPEQQARKRERNRKWQAEHPEKHRERNRKYYAEHPEKHRERNRKYYAEHPEKHRERNRKWQAEHPEKGREREYRRNYGITIEDYERRLVEQDGKCAICGEPPSVGGKRLSVDHDHETGKIRALLCQRCNLVVGGLKESAAFARLVADYLEKHK